MKGLIFKAVLGGFGLAALAASGCTGVEKCVDPCWPERWNYMARQEVYAASAPQIRNGHVLDQTVWNWQFEAGSDKLHPAGLEHLDYILRRRPHPDTHIYVQTAGATDVQYDPKEPEKFVEKRIDLDMRRVQAVEKYLHAASAGRGVAWQVAVHDPGDPSLRAIPIGNAVQGMYGSFSGTLGGAGGANGLGFGGIATGGLGGGAVVIGGAGAVAQPAARPPVGPPRGKPEVKPPAARQTVAEPRTARTTGTHIMNLKLTLGGSLVFLVLLFATPVPIQAAAPAAPIASSPVLIADQPWHKQAYDWVAHWLSNRTRMIQFAVVGMIIALIIICRNRW